MKLCNTCKVEKVLSEFYSYMKFSRIKGDYLYYQPECKNCTSIRSLRNQRAKPEQRLISGRRNSQTPKRKKAFRENAKRRKESGQHAEWIRNNPDKVFVYGQDRAKKNHKISQKEWDSCRQYFNFRCAYCGKTWEQNKLETKKDLHKEHLDNEGKDDLSNCIPSCRDCNSHKWEFKFDDWYSVDVNANFSEERKTKILSWINEDYRKYIVYVNHN